MRSPKRLVFQNLGFWMRQLKILLKKYEKKDG